jgi:hypothetical protein
MLRQMTLVPRARPSPPDSRAAEDERLPEELRSFYAVTNGCGIEWNLIDGAPDESLREIVPFERLEHRSAAVVFGCGSFGATFEMDTTGAVDLVWGQEHRAAIGTDRTRVGSSLAELVARLVVVDKEDAFAGQPLLSEYFQELRQPVERIALPRRMTPSGAPAVSALSGEARAYFDALPGWLRELLSQCNGGTVQGIELEVPTPMGTREVETLTELFCVSNRRQERVTDASSLHQALTSQGMRERLFPFARTTLNATLLTDAAGAIHVWPDEAGAEDIEAFDNPDDLITALRQAAQSPSSA